MMYAPIIIGDYATNSEVREPDLMNFPAFSIG